MPVTAAPSAGGAIDHAAQVNPSGSDPVISRSVESVAGEVARNLAPLLEVPYISGPLHATLLYFQRKCAEAAVVLSILQWAAVRNNGLKSPLLLLISAPEQ